MKIDELVSKIKQKKELSGIPNSFIMPILEKTLRRYNLKTENLSKSEISVIVKESRAELRNYVGRFHSSQKNRMNLLVQDEIDRLLSSHSSTRERVSFYPELISLLEKLNVKTVIDLGSGINPLAMAYRFKEYYAYDINENDISLVQEFFKTKNILGSAVVQDIRQPFSYPSADICLIFKVLDIIEKKGHKIADNLISNIKCKYILISFATRTLSGKPMKYAQRGWIEKILSKHGRSFKIINSENEIFYLAYPNNTLAPI